MAVVDRTGVYNNGLSGGVAVGSLTTGAVSVTVADSVASNNGTPGNGGGFLALSAVNQGVTHLHVTRSVAATNPGSGVLATGTNAVAFVDGSAVVSNVSGWLATAGGQIFTFGNNVVTGNGGDQGAQTPVALK